MTPQNALLILVYLCTLHFTNGLLETPITYAGTDIPCKTKGDEECAGLNSFPAYCDCDIHCIQFGTCCAGSRHVSYIRPKVRPTCHNSNRGDIGILMVDQCPQTRVTKSVYADLCQEEEESDLLRLVPVTSLYTDLTYKNLFCFRCHESHDELVFWKVRIQYDGETNVSEKDPGVHLSYDRYRKTWVAPVGNGGIYVPVTLDTINQPDSPHSMYWRIKMCLLSVITNCSENWPDDEIKAKCEAYMELIDIPKNGTRTRLTYKNRHCAICNFESLENAVCHEVDPSEGKKLFSFTYFLDINRSDGDKVGKVERCKGNDIWDPYFETCRALKCALPGHFMVNGRCVRKP